MINDKKRVSKIIYLNTFQYKINLDKFDFEILNFKKV